jgi:hypothetical protein
MLVAEDLESRDLPGKTEPSKPVSSSHHPTALSCLRCAKTTLEGLARWLLAVDQHDHAINKTRTLVRAFGLLSDGGLMDFWRCDSIDRLRIRTWTADLRPV